MKFPNFRSTTGVRTSLMLLVLLFLAANVLADDQAKFLRTYCYDCHSDLSQNGGLSLESLAPEFADPKLHDVWTRVHDRIRDGKMPPTDEVQPTDQDRRSFLKQLGSNLHTASIEQQQEGRVTLRRLSRVEYENTLHDLLGISVDLKSLLPEDNLVAGFDNVSVGLETSATHLVRYQEAADLALSEVLPVDFRNRATQVWRSTGREWFENFPAIYHKNVTPWSKLEGDSFVYQAQLDIHASLRSARVPVTGRYRVRAAVRARNNGGQPIPVDIARLSTDRFDRQDREHLLGIEDAVEEETRIISAEGILTKGDTAYLSPRTLMAHRRLPKGMPGPGEENFQQAELIVDWIELAGPLETGDHFQALFGDQPRVPDRYLQQSMDGATRLPDWNRWHPNEFLKPQNRLRFATKTPREDAARLIGEFLPKAIRRPPTTELTEHYIQRANEMFDEGLLLDEVLLRVYKEILCSAQFLFHIEQPGELDDYALASRLSYMLWNSMPDEELIAVAAKGELRRPEVLHAQTERLLKHAKSERFINHFTGLWLNLFEVNEMKPDTIYREYDEALAWSMPIETRLFFTEVLKHDLPVTSFVHSDWTFLNGRLALHYGIAGVDGMNFRRVKLPSDAHRGGVMTHASILKVTTNASYTSPIKRGAWVLERILGTPPSPPPPNVEAIEPDIRGAVTLREQMALHQSQAVCASCHASIDPPGFALENYDVLGGWRERYRVSKGGAGNDYLPLPNHPQQGTKAWMAKPVEAQGETESGQAFANIDEYKQLLLQNPDQLSRNLAEKLMIYGTGGTIEFADRQAIEEIVAANRLDGYGLRSLLHAVIQSEVFRRK